MTDPAPGTDQINWIVKIIMVQKGNRYKCTGSLYKPTKVLTAAHCLYGKESSKLIDPNDIEVYAFDFKTNQEFAYRVKRTTVHPDYKSDLDMIIPKKFDLGLIELLDPVTPSIYGSLPKLVLVKNELNHLRIPGGPISFFGYGISITPRSYEKLFYGEGIAQSAETCYAAMLRNQFGNRSTCYKMPELESSVNFFCLLTGARSAGTLSGDSGGPATVYRDGKHYLVGVATAGNEKMKYEVAKFSLFETLDRSSTIRWLMEFDKNVDRDM